RIPKQLCQHPCSHLRHFRPVALVSALLKNSFYPKLLKQPHIRPERKPIWMRMNISTEISRIIPDVKPRTDLRPPFEVRHKSRVGCLIQWLAKVAFNR